MGSALDVDAQEAVNDQTGTEEEDTLAAALDSTDEDDSAIDESSKSVEKEKEAEDDDESTEEAETELQRLQRQNDELKTMIRASSRDFRIMQEKLNRIERLSTKQAATTNQVNRDAFDDEDEDDDGGIDSSNTGQAESAAPPKLSRVDELQAEIAQIAEAKKGTFDIMLDMIEETKAYADVRTVCSQGNFNEIFDAVGEKVADDVGMDPLEASLEVERSVWEKPNPYKYMYKLIKKYHPDYAQAGENAERSAETKQSEKAVKEPKPTPSSIANLSGGGTDQG